MNPSQQQKQSRNSLSAFGSQMGRFSVFFFSDMQTRFGEEAAL